MKTICYIGHPDVATSSSQQFLIQSGKSRADVTYVDLTKSLSDMVPDQEANRLCKYDQILLQFPLYWYQAPAIIKEWIDKVLGNIPVSKLKGKRFGIVVVVGSKQEEYQAGGRVGRTLSELLSPYQVLAQYFEMNYQPLFPVFQFQYKSESEKMELMWRYLYYLKVKEPLNLANWRRFLLSEVETSSWIDLDEESKLIWESYLNHIEDQGEQLDELMRLNANDSKSI